MSGLEEFTYAIQDSRLRYVKAIWHTDEFKVLMKACSVHLTHPYATTFVMSYSYITFRIARVYSKILFMKYSWNMCKNLISIPLMALANVKVGDLALYICAVRGYDVSRDESDRLLSFNVAVKAKLNKKLRASGLLTK